eukprot:8766089-Alexandrium_andersonii.AAC.1
MVAHARARAQRSPLGKARPGARARQGTVAGRAEGHTETETERQRRRRRNWEVAQTTAIIGA